MLQIILEVINSRLYYSTIHMWKIQQNFALFVKILIFRIICEKLLLAIYAVQLQ